MTTTTDATKAMTNITKQQLGPCHQRRNRDLAYNLVEKCQTTGFYPTIKENRRQEGKRTSQPSTHQKRKTKNLVLYIFHLFCILKDNQ